MVATSSRILQLLSLLQTHRYWPGTELAHRLDVSLRTLRRDIDRLRDLGYPVEAQRGVDGGYQLAPGATMPPLVVDDEEAVAVALGLLTGAESPVAGTAEASVRALGKVIQVMPKRLRRRVDALRATVEAATWGPPAATVDGETLVTVAQACRDSERLDFDYTGGPESPWRDELRCGVRELRQMARDRFAAIAAGDERSTTSSATTKTPRWRSHSSGGSGLRLGRYWLAP